MKQYDVGFRLFLAVHLRKGERACREFDFMKLDYAEGKYQKCEQLQAKRFEKFVDLFRLMVG